MFYKTNSSCKYYFSRFFCYFSCFLVILVLFLRNKLILINIMQEIPKSWSVLHAKNKTEILVTERLKSIGFETYAKAIFRHWSDCKKTVKLPLLPSMVLMSITPKNFNKVFDVPGVIGYLFIDGQKSEVLPISKIHSKKNLQLLLRKQRCLI